VKVMQLGIPLWRRSPKRCARHPQSAEPILTDNALRVCERRFVTPCASEAVLK
jgi:hypothetical protein